MITKRIIPCLDVRNGRVVKGTNFEGIRDVADPVEMARMYNAAGADELVFYDITASFEGRALFTDILTRVASEIFIPLTVGGGIRTVAADPAKLEDPHLIIYNAVLTLRETTVVTNGDQTDTIARFMNGNLFPGYSFEAALATRTYEDDAPNFTPRISGVVDMRRGGYKLSIVKSDEGNAESVQRQTFDYPQPVAGEGHFISTYVKNGAPIPSFAGEPLRVAIDTNDADKFADKLWVSLNEDNKVSLFVRSIELETGEYEDIILNKYTAVEG